MVLLDILQDSIY